MTLPLEGVRVIDLSQVFMGPTAAQTLGDFGADVIKVERPGTGEISRTAIDDPLGELNPVFSSLNRNKRALTLDLRNPLGTEVLLRLLDDADVLLANFRPGVLEKMGLGASCLHERNPRLIIATGSGFGTSGPLASKAGQDFLAQAASGLMSRRLDQRLPPTVPNTAMADYVTGQHLVQGILLALLARERTGVGQEVTVSLYASMIAAQMQEATVERMRSRELNWAATLLTGCFQTKDGAVMVVGSFSQFENTLPAFAAALGIPEFLSPEFEAIDDALAAEAHLRELLARRLAGLTTEEALTSLEGERILCSRVTPLSEALKHEQTSVNGMLLDIPLEGRETIKTVGTPIRLSGTPAEVRLPPPAVGQHRLEILDEAGFDADAIAALAEGGAFGSVVGGTG